MDRIPAVRISRLANGLRVVSETMPGVPSVSLGIWVENGSRYERRAQAGISHYLEHLFFKGTERRTAAQLAEELDSVGGFFNAFTGKETTCYYAKVLGEHLPLAQDVLGDIFRHSRFAEDEIERERSVIVQEILQGEDSPDEHVHDLFHLHYWPNHPLSFPVCGRVETVESLRRDDFLSFLGERYRPDRILIAAAGAVEHDALLDWAGNTFADLSGVTAAAPSEPPSPARVVRHIDKQLEQVHVCVGAPGLAQTAPERFAGYLLNSVLGGGMSSRLFQEIREKRGRAYSVYSFLSSFSDSGYLGVYAATSPEWVSEVADLILVELQNVAREGLTPSELTRAKNQLKGNILLGLETTDSRMHRIARNQLYFQREIPIAELASSIDATCNEDIVAVARAAARPEAMALTLLGDLKGHSVPTEMFG